MARGTRKKGARSAFGNLTEEYVKTSECFVSLIEVEGVLESCYIEFKGECARVPSLKNARRRFSLEYSARCRLVAMSRLFKEQLKELGKETATFNDRNVIALLLCGRRGNRSFDALNVADTVSDWLEPDTKQGGNSDKHSRGWGVGLVTNDSGVRILPLLASDIGQDTETTTIIIRDFTSVRKQTIDFVTEFFLPTLRPKITA